MENKELVKCDTCNGHKEVMISCCTGEVIHDDMDLCPSCHEHLGLEECPDCDGTGQVPADKKDFVNAIPGLQTITEHISDINKEGEL